MFPKVAVVCGAHTELGKYVVRDLLRAEGIGQVYALAEVDCRDNIRVRPQHEQKFHLIVDNLDFIERIISLHVPECDLAFSCLGSCKEDFSTMGSYAFHKQNFDIPSRFIHQMHELGALRIAVLSHAKADSKSKKSEFLRVKGQLEEFLAEMHKRSCGYGPGISLMKVPRLLTNLKDQNGIRGHSISASQRFKEATALKFNAGPAQAVHVRDVAKAMCVDALEKADMEEESDLAAMFLRNKIGFTQLTGPDIAGVAEEARDVERGNRQMQIAQRQLGDKLSPYSKQNMLLDIAARSRERHEQHEHHHGDLEDDFEDSSQSPNSKVSILEQVRAEHGIPSDHRRASSKNDDDDSFEGRAPSRASGRPDSPHTDFGDDFQDDDRGSSSVRRGPIHSDSPGRSEERRARNIPTRLHDGVTDFGSDFDGERDSERGSIHGTSLHGSEFSHASSVLQMGSVESLGHQMGRPLTDIVGNRILPDVEEHSVSHASMNNSLHSRSRRARSNRTASVSSHHTRVDSRAESASRKSEVYSMGRQSLQSAPSQQRSHRSSNNQSTRASSSHRKKTVPSMDGFDDEERKKFFLAESELSASNFDANAMTRRRSSAGARGRHLDERYFRRENHPSLVQDSRSRRRRSEASIRPDRSSRSGSVGWKGSTSGSGNRFSTFASRVIAATDRPSMRSAQSYQSRDHGLSQDLDLRPLGSTVI